MFQEDIIQTHNSHIASQPDLKLKVTLKHPELHHDFNKESKLTQIIKICVDAIRPWHRADQSGFEERGPFINQHPLSTYIILERKHMLIHQFK